MICNYDYAQVVNVEKADKQIRQVYPSKSFSMVVLCSQIFNRCRRFSKYSTHQQTQAGSYIPASSLSMTFLSLFGTSETKRAKTTLMYDFMLLIPRLIIYPMIPCRFDRVYRSDGVIILLTRSHSSLNFWKPIRVCSIGLNL